MCYIIQKNSINLSTTKYDFTTFKHFFLFIHFELTRLSKSFLKSRITFFLFIGTHIFKAIFFFFRESRLIRLNRQTFVKSLNKISTFINFGKLQKRKIYSAIHTSIKNESILNICSFCDSSAFFLSFGRGSRGWSTKNEIYSRFSGSCPLCGFIS